MGLRLSSSFQHIYDFQSIHPAPLRSRSGADGIEYFFHRPSSGALTVVFWGTPRQSIGQTRMEVQAAGKPVQFSVFIYP
jgi:hypothetical protein